MFRIFSRQGFFIASASLLFLGAFSPVYAQTASAGVVLTSCTPNFSIHKDGTFVTKKGDVVVFSCVLKNDGVASTTVLLSGTRTEDTAAGATPSAVSLAVSVPSRETVTAEIPFLTLLENGTYRYAITLETLPDGTPFGPTLDFTSTLDAPTIRIVDAVLDKSAYAPGDTVSLLVTVATSSPGTADKTATPFFLDGILKGKGGETCSYVVSDMQITSDTTRVFFQVPAASSGTCSSAALGVVLKDKGGYPQDSRDIPLTVSAPSILMGGSASALLVLVVLIVLAWVLRVVYLRRAKNTVL